jgi:hypothetical protein
MNKTITLIASLLLFPSHTFAVQTFPQKVSQTKVETSTCQITPENPETGEYSEKQLQTLAENITVRVIGIGDKLRKRGNCQE